MSAHRPTYIVAVALMAFLAAACTEHNPRYCNTNADCGSNAYPFCDLSGRFDGVGNRCIANPYDGDVMSCQTSAECTDPKAPLCEQANSACLPCTDVSQSDTECASRDPATPVCASDGRCVPCEGDLDCPDAMPLCDGNNTCMSCTVDEAGDTDCAARDSDKPRCVDGGCYECATDTDCPMTEPVCDGMGHFCRPCTNHPECNSDICDPDNGQCVPDGSVIYVGHGGGDSSGCGSQASPCATIQYALGKLGNGKDTLRVLGSGTAYQGQVDIDGTTVTIYGDGATINPISSDVPALLVRNSAKVEIEGLHITRAAGSLGDGVYCRGPSTSLRLYHVTVDNNDGQGIDAADGCALTVERSLIDRNTSGGALISNTSFTLLNNFIIRNGDVGSSGSLFGGVRISNGGDFTQVLDYNTIADSRANTNAPGAAVSCEVTKAMQASNNVVYLHTGGTATVSNTNCTWTYSDIQGMSTGTGNFDADPSFADLGMADFHLMPGSPCRDKATPTSNKIDFDGESRPEGAAPDVGADEVYDSN